MVTGNPAYQLQLAQPVHGERRHAGRHRLGRPDARRCRDLVTVPTGDAAPNRHRSDRTAATPSGVGVRVAATLVSVTAGAVLAVSGWYAAAGLAVLAEVIR